jgi:hypothetical protein
VLGRYRSARVQIGYDAQGRLQQAAFFDGQGRPAVLASGASRLQWQHDAAGACQQHLLDAAGRLLGRQGCF